MSDSNDIDTDEYMYQAFASLEAIEHLRSGLLNSELAHRIEKNYKKNNETPYFIYRALIKNSIISSACALEANINEWFSHFENFADPDSKKEQTISKL